MVDGTMSTRARARTGGAVGRALMGLVLLGALAGCSQPGVTRLAPSEPMSGPVANGEPRLGFSGFAGMGGLPMP